MEVKKVNLTPGPTPVTSFEVSDPPMSNLVYFQCHFEDFKQSNMPKMMCICIITSLQMYFGLLGTVWNAPKSP